MRPAEILAETLLAEASNFGACVWGPNIPATGFYVTGNTEKQLWDKTKRYLGSEGAIDQTPNSLIQLWLLQGHSILVSKAPGALVFYGKPVQANEQTIYVYGLKSGTTITHVTRTAKGLVNHLSNAATVLGVT